MACLLCLIKQLLRWGLLNFQILFSVKLPTRPNVSLKEKVMRTFKKLVLAIVMFSSMGGVSSVFADDWTATRLRGLVYAIDAGQWLPVNRGDIVSDDRMIRTAQNGRVVFERDGESIELGADTTIQIQDRVGARFTTVHQHSGDITVVANVENVQHFSVQTPFLAAVVKGTSFRVLANPEESEVMVIRGRVEVRDPAHRTNVTITRGQSATASRQVALAAYGDNVAPVLNANGSVYQTPAMIAAAAEVVLPASATPPPNGNEAARDNTFHHEETSDSNN